MRKKVIVSVILVILIICNVSSCYAKPNWSIWSTAKNWINVGKTESQSGSVHNQLGEVDKSGFNDLAGILFGAGTFVIVIVGTFLGVKYMFASVEERATIKGAIIPFLIGSAIILGALSIWKFGVKLLADI